MTELEETKIMEVKYRSILLFLIREPWFQEEASEQLQLPDTDTLEEFTTRLVCEIGRRLDSNYKQIMN